MATLTAQQITATGIEPTYAAADVAGDVVAYTADTFFHVINGDASPHTVSVVSQYSAAPGIAPADIEVAIPAGEDRMIGPLNSTFFRSADNEIEITYDGVTDVTIAALRL